jgi:tetratricopeptide (TPR) repeat protein
MHARSAFFLRKPAAAQAPYDPLAAPDIKISQGWYAEAARDLEALLGANPQSVLNLYLLAAAVTGLQEHQRAIDLTTVAINLNPTFDLAFTQRAAAKFGLGDFQGALLDVDRALVLQPNDPSATQMRERLLERMAAPQL